MPSMDLHVVVAVIVVVVDVELMVTTSWMCCISFVVNAHMTVGLVICDDNQLIAGEFGDNNMSSSSLDAVEPPGQQQQQPTM